MQVEVETNAESVQDVAPIVAPGYFSNALSIPEA